MSLCLVGGKVMLKNEKKLLHISLWYSYYHMGEKRRLQYSLSNVENFDFCNKNNETNIIEQLKKTKRKFIV